MPQIHYISIIAADQKRDENEMAALKAIILIVCTQLRL